MSTTTVSGIALLCAGLFLAGLLAGCLGGEQPPQQLSGVEVCGNTMVSPSPLSMTSGRTPSWARSRSISRTTVSSSTGW